MENEYFFNAAGIPPTLPFQPSLSPMHIPNDFRNPNFEKSTERYYQLESAVSSMVSSPAAHISAADSAIDTYAIRELIGKLGTVYDSGEISPEFFHKTTYNGGRNNSPNTSCYSTPRNSPSQLHVPIINHFVNEKLPNLGNSVPMNSALPALPADPGFAERAAKFSCFGSRSFNGRTTQIGLNKPELQYRSSGLSMGNGKLARIASSPSLKIAGSPINTEENKNSVRNGNGKVRNLSGSAGNSNEESSVSEQNPSEENGLRTPNELNSRKRKGVSREKAKEATLSQSDNATKEAAGDDGSNLKRSKLNCGNKDDVKAEEVAANEDHKQANNIQKPPEPPKDYIHVRARRGQATDSHSLAERVRREKISERMKLLQDLVPGCNKVTGKALMLDEIINYVQSLQCQVQFLSMKLATVNPRLDIDMDSLLSKNIIQENGTLPQQIYPVDSQEHKSVEQLDAALFHNLSMQLDGFGGGLHQFPAFSEDDLQSIVQMGCAPNQTPHMKIEI